MRLTGLGQYARGLAHYNPLEATALQDRLERIKWRLWHGDADEALARTRILAEDLAAVFSPYPGLTRLIKATARLATYIGNNSAAITDYAERWDHGEIISTAFVESTVDLVISRRFAKNSRCNGQERALIDSCRPERAPLTARCATCSPTGIRLCPLTMFNSPRSSSQPELHHGFWFSHEQAEADDLRQSMNDPPRRPGIFQARRKQVGDPQQLLDLPQAQHAGIG
jgi:hypothetical protein